MNMSLKDFSKKDVESLDCIDGVKIDGNTYNEGLKQAKHVKETDPETFKNVEDAYSKYSKMPEGD